MDAEVKKIIDTLQNQVNSLQMEVNRIKRRVSEDSRDLDQLWQHTFPGNTVPSRWTTDL